MANYSKIYTKRFAGPSEAHLLTGYPMMFAQAAGITPYEFKEQNVIEAVTVTACTVSLNFAFLGEKTFEGIGSITGLELSANHKFLVLVGSNLKILYVKRSTLEVLATTLLESKSEKVLGISRSLEESVIQILTPERMEIIPPDRLLQTASDISENRVPKVQGVCQFSIEGLVLVASDICRTMAVSITLSGEVLLILFKQHKHYTVFFKLEEPTNIKQVKILGVTNHILFVDSAQQSFILSIEEKYLLKNSFDFNIATCKDFFRIRKIGVKFGGGFDDVLIGSLVDGQIESDILPSSSEVEITKFMFDPVGNLLKFKLKESLDGRNKSVGLYELLNYLKSHNFEYKLSVLSSYRSIQLESQIRNVMSYIEAQPYKFSDAKPQYGSIIGSTKEALLLCLSSTSIAKANINLNSLQNLFNGDKTDEEAPPDDDIIDVDLMRAIIASEANRKVQIQTLSNINLETQTVLMDAPTTSESDAQKKSAAQTQRKQLSRPPSKINNNSIEGIQNGHSYRLHAGETDLSRRHSRVGASLDSNVPATGALKLAEPSSFGKISNTSNTLAGGQSPDQKNEVYQKLVKDSWANAGEMNKKKEKRSVSSHVVYELAYLVKDVDKLATNLHDRLFLKPKSALEEYQQHEAKKKREEKKQAERRLLGKNPGEGGKSGSSMLRSVKVVEEGSKSLKDEVSLRKEQIGGVNRAVPSTGRWTQGRGKQHLRALNRSVGSTNVLPQL
jgi:hypothetical protein